MLAPSSWTLCLMLSTASAAWFSIFNHGIAALDKAVAEATEQKNHGACSIPEGIGHCSQRTLGPHHERVYMMLQQKVMHCLLVGLHRMGGYAGAFKGLRLPNKAIAG